MFKTIDQYLDVYRNRVEVFASWCERVKLIKKKGAQHQNEADKSSYTELRDEFLRWELTLGIMASVLGLSTEEKKEHHKAAGAPYTFEEWRVFIGM